jgi:hypothetical protein
MATNPTNPPEPAPKADQIPRYTASGAPVTRADRIAFQVWLVCVLLTVVITLLLFLFDKIYFAFTGR